MEGWSETCNITGYEHEVGWELGTPVGKNQQSFQKRMQPSRHVNFSMVGLMTYRTII